MNRLTILLFAMIAGSAGAASVTNVLARQQWPWSGKVHIDYRLVDADGEKYDVQVSVKKNGADVAVNPASFSGDVYAVGDGEHRIVWDPACAGVSGGQNVADCTFSLSVKPAVVHKYLVLDLSGGSGRNARYPSYLLADVPEGGWGPEYKTTKLVLRRCEPGTFMMGSPEDEAFRELPGASAENQSEVTFTNHFYIGVFELTVKQHELIAGSNVTYVTDNNEVVVDGDNPLVPATGLRYKDLRGAVNGIKWPSKIGVDEGSFMALLRSRADLPDSVPPGWVFDLPTEAQWEYACRAGTTQPHYDGTVPDPTSDTSAATDRNLEALGWYRANSGYKRHEVGLKRQNAWGLYDMYGNASEYVLEGTDGSGTMPSGVEPKNVTPTRNYGLARRVRGGSFCGSFMHCRSASRRELFNMDDSVNKLRYDTGNGFAMGARICLHYVE